MANKIQLRRGLKSAMPTGLSGEPMYATDTRELFVGTGSGNVNMGGSHWYRGTAMSGTTTAANTYSYSACPDVKLDDIYLNTSNGNIYACTTAGKGSAAKWTYQGCMKGVQGETGAAGIVIVDSDLIGISTNPVQNKVIKTEFENMVKMMGKLTNTEVETDTINKAKYLPLSLSSAGHQKVSVLCYRADGMPEDVIGGLLVTENIDYTNGLLSQSFYDWATGNSYARDLPGSYDDDGEFAPFDGELTYEEANWIKL